jgi:hypothetical protein
MSQPFCLPSGLLNIGVTGVKDGLDYVPILVLSGLVYNCKDVPEALRHEDVWGSGCIDPSFLDLGTSWR